VHIPVVEITQDRIVHFLLLFLFFAGSVFTGGLLLKWYTRDTLRRKLTKRVHRAAAGEKNARCFLIDHGFTILNEQAYIKKKLAVDGVSVPFTLRADFIVRKGRRNAVVDAKSGSQAADPRNPETRRRMLEYFCYYDVKDAYIYDDVKKSLKKIVFTDVFLRMCSWKLFIAGILCGCICCIVLYLLIRGMDLAFF
jgi:hypothetical protein